MAFRIIVLVLFIVFITGTKSFEKPGSCPVVAEGTRGTCVEECSSDDSCPGDEKCCSNGCGHTCRRPANLTCPTLVCDEDLDCTRHGYKLDEWGCAMCECYVDPCPMFKCRACPEYYNYRLIDGHLCRGCECVSSVQCPKLQCECPPGYKPDGDINGCPTCRCVPDTDVCPKLTCDLDCSESGYKLDEHGCAMCECYIDPCPLLKCRACPEYYDYFAMEKNVCRGCECVSNIQCPKLQCECPLGYKPDGDINGCPTCRCVPDEGVCPKLTCDLECSESGYKLDERGCAMCECYVDPCPMFGCVACPKHYDYFVTDGHICRGCDCVSSIQCPKLQCECPPGYKPDGDINGCPTCRCVPDGDVNLTCDLECPESGYKLDERGNAMCECYVDPCPLFLCEPCPKPKYYDYFVMDGAICRGCGCVFSIQCPELKCECPPGKRPGCDINGCPTCRCVPINGRTCVVPLGVYEIVYIIVGSLALVLIVSGIVGFIICRKKAKKNNETVRSPDVKKEPLFDTDYPTVSSANAPLDSEKNLIM